MIQTVADLGIFGGGDGWRVREHEPIWGYMRVYEPIWGSGGYAPSGVQGNAPGGGSGGLCPPEADDFFTLAGEIKRKKLLYFQHC